MTQSYPLHSIILALVNNYCVNEPPKIISIQNWYKSVLKKFSISKLRQTDVLSRASKHLNTSQSVHAASFPSES